MPRIDPYQLLKTLGVLLGPAGGIRSKDEVARIATLMQKFSKKLVSKCIYVQILEATREDLLDLFLEQNGWALLSAWFADAVRAANWPFVAEMLRLYRRCPITADRLASNVAGVESSAPKLVNQLRHDPQVDQSLRDVAVSVYDKWYVIVQPANGDMEEDESVDSTEDGIKEGENGSISLLQSLADEVSESIKEEKQAATKPVATTPKAVQKTSQNGKMPSSKPAKDSKSAVKEKSSKEVKESRKRKEDKSSKDRERDRKRYRGDRRDEVDPAEKQRIKEIAKRMKDEEEKKKHKETLKTVQSAGGASLAKIPRIPKKSKEEKGGASFEEMLGGLDAKPKTVKTPMNKNKTASLLEGLTKSSSSLSSSSSTKEKESSKDSKHSSSSSTSSRHSSSYGHHRREDRHRSSNGGVSQKKDSSSSSSSHHTKKESSSSKSSGSKSLEPSPSRPKLSIPEKRRSTDQQESPKASSKKHNFSESTGFMDAIFSSMSNEPRKKKRRLSEADNSSKKSGATPESPTTSKSKAVKTEDKQEVKREEKPAPAFSFYKDTYAEEEVKEEVEEKKVVKEEDDVNDDAEDKPESIENPKKEEEDEGPTLTDPLDSLPREVKGILVIHHGLQKRNKKIRWREDNDLVATRYFELDEGERVNVNKIKFENMMAMEKKMESAAMKVKEQDLVDEPTIKWYKPKLVEVTKEESDFAHGSTSVEKDIQQVREKNILQALYFSKAMTPPSPAEPDLEAHDHKEPAFIPLEDVEAGAESVTDFSNSGWCKPQFNDVDQQASLESTFSLPPALSNILKDLNLTKNLVPSQSAGGGPMSDEERNMLVAQTEAMKAMGMLPGLNGPPNFPPPANSGPPAGPPPMNLPPPSRTFDRPPHGFNHPPPMSGPPPTGPPPDGFGNIQPPNFPPPPRHNGPPPPFRGGFRGQGGGPPGGGFGRGGNFRGGGFNNHRCVGGHECVIDQGVNVFDLQGRRRRWLSRRPRGHAHEGRQVQDSPLLLLSGGVLP